MQQNEKKFFQERYRKIHHEFNNLTDLELRTFKLLDEEITEDIRRLDQYMRFREIDFEDADALMLSEPFNQASFRHEYDIEDHVRRVDEHELQMNNFIIAFDFGYIVEKVKYDEDQAQVVTYTKIIEDQERTLEDTKTRFIAIVSMVAVV
ncbi:MAG: hypothetical protein EZS28_046523, partial [Streblomastix strix]